MSNSNPDIHILRNKAKLLTKLLAMLRADTPTNERANALEKVNSFFANGCDPSQFRVEPSDKLSPWAAYDELLRRQKGSQEQISDLNGLIERLREEIANRKRDDATMKERRQKRADPEKKIPLTSMNCA